MGAGAARGAGNGGRQSCARAVGCAAAECHRFTAKCLRARAAIGRTRRLAVLRRDMLPIAAIRADREVDEGGDRAALRLHREIPGRDRFRDGAAFRASSRRTAAASPSQQARADMAEAVLDGLPPFRPRLPWWGPDLQTIRSVVVRSRALDGHAGERHYFPFADGSGDRLAAILNRPVAATTKPLIVLVHVFESLPAGLTPHGVVAVGYSLGANLLLKYLGERGGGAHIDAAAVVSAPLDLAGTARRLGRFRNTAYQRYLLRYMKAEAVAPGADLSAAERRTVLDARSVWEFDHVYSAPRAGYDGATDYYARTASGRFLGGVTVPTLVIHALDDPWIPPEPYRDFDWQRHANLRAVLTRRGGHVGFHGGDDVAWHDLAIARFFDGLSRP